MAWLTSSVGRVNKWFDSLKEPNRFLVFLVLFMGWVPLMYTPSKTLWIIGGVWMSITCTMALFRIWR